MSGAVNTIKKAVTNPGGAIGAVGGMGWGALNLGGLGGIANSAIGGFAGAHLGNALGSALGMKNPSAPGGGGGQSDYGSFIQSMAMGNGPSVAQTQLQQGLGSALANSQAMASSQRGISPALAARMAMQNQAGMQNQANIGSALLRSQEQMNAAGMWGNYLAGQQNNALARDQMQAQKDIAHSQQNTAILGGLLQGGGAMLGLGGKPSSGNDISNNFQNHSVGGGGGRTVSPYASGGVVPGQAVAAGDDPKNDKVPAMLSPGEVVLPRSVLQGPNMEEKVLEFLKHIKTKDKGYAKVAKAKMNCGGKVYGR